MKKMLLYVACCMAAITANGQGLVRVGGQLPKYYFTQIINAPVKQASTESFLGKPLIIVFWGTWCSPCVPEMINLGKLQKQFGDKVQILGVSYDSEQKLQFFNQKRPSKVWFASDPSQNLWNIFGISAAGHTALIDDKGKIVAITETHLIDSSVIQNLVTAKQILLEENKGARRMTENDAPNRADSATQYSFVIHPALKDIVPTLRVPPIGPFAKRRFTAINLPPVAILSEAYNISAPQKVVFASIADSLKSDQEPLYVDLIVANDKKQELYTLLRNELNLHLPVKGELIKKEIDCYILQPIAGKQVNIPQSPESASTALFGSLSFTGKGIRITTFVDYLENELHYPIYDNTGLTQNYDINFSKNNIDPARSIIENLQKMGLELVKGRKEMDVLFISSN